MWHTDSLYGGVGDISERMYVWFYHPVQSRQYGMLSNPTFTEVSNYQTWNDECVF